MSKRWVVRTPDSAWWFHYRFMARFARWTLDWFFAQDAVMSDEHKPTVTE